jgi:hypothetical protein
MNQDLTNELAEARAQLEAARTRIERVEAELAKKGKPWEPWKPEAGQEYFCVIGDGSVERSTWDDGWYDRNCRNFNNCRPTEKAAGRHALRLRSMRPTCPLPKVGDTVWFISIAESSGAIKGYWESWEGTPWQLWQRNSGRQFATEDALNAWVAEFGDAWTTLEDEA